MIVQVHTRVPVEILPDDVREKYVLHRQEVLAEQFGIELMRVLENGGIVGPIHQQRRDVESWLGPVVEMGIYCNVFELPPPEQYRMMGGPADGATAATGGVPIFRIPVLQPMMTSPWDVREDPVVMYAEYERQGDTQAYLFRRLETMG